MLVALVASAARPATTSSPPVSTSPPTVTGTFRNGETLTASSGGWSGLTPISYAYQWQDCPTYPSTVGADTAFGWWRLEDSNGTALDSGSGAVNGTYVGGVTQRVAGPILGEPDYAASFNGTSGYISFPGTVQFDSGDFALEAWFKTTNASADQTIWTSGQTNSSGSQVALLKLRTANIRFVVKDGTNTVALQSTTSYSDGAWHHVVATRTGTSFAVYMDGQTTPILSTTSAMGDVDLAGSPARIGADASTAFLFQGSLDEVAIYKHTLAAARVGVHYGAGADKNPSCTNVLGATDQVYLVAPGDIGSKLRVQVTATNADGSASAGSAANLVAGSGPVNEAPPGITGAADQGQTLQGGSGQWSGVQPISYAYQWRRCGYRTVVVADQPLAYWRLGEKAGATAADTSGHGVTGTYVNHPAFAVAGAASGDPDTAVFFEAAHSEAVTAPGSFPTAHQPASVELWIRAESWPATVRAGLAGYGSTLSGYLGSSFEVQALPSGKINVRDGNLTSTATLTAKTWYQLVAVDDGSTMRLYINGVLDATSASGAAAVKASGYASIGRDDEGKYFNGTVDDVSIYGSALTATQVQAHYDAGVAENSSTGCVDIAGATTTSYTVAAPDTGTKLQLKVTATNADGTATAISASKPVTTLAPANLVEPSVNGNPTQGETLTATPGDWAGTSPLSYAYQWKRCNYRATVLANSPLAYWRLGEVTGTSAKDESGNGHLGSYTQLVGGPSPGALPGDGDGSQQFSGQASGLSVPYDTALNPSLYSVEAWIRPSTEEVSNDVIMQAAAPVAWSLHYADSGGANPRRLAFGATNTSGTTYTAYGTTQAVDLNHWYHVVGVLTATQVQLYVDGTLEGTATFSGTRQSLTTGSQIEFGYGFNGWIDEAAFYGSSLSATTIQAHRNAGSCSDISGATSSSYTVTSADVGTNIGVTATASNVAGTSSASATTLPVAGSAQPANITPPAITETTDTGSPTFDPSVRSFTADPGRWSGATPMTYSYQWQRCGDYAAAVRDDGPSAYWRLGEPRGPNAVDSVASFGGTYAGGITYGVLGALLTDTDPAVTFNGSSGVVDVPAGAMDAGVVSGGDPNVPGYYTLTLEAWVKGPATGSPSYSMIVGHTVDSATPGAQLLSGTNVTFRLSSDVTGVNELADPNALGTGWHYFVARYDGLSMELYRDGQNVGRKDVKNPDGSNFVIPSGGVGRIGRDTTFPNNYFNGSVDEVASYPSALPTARISAHYAAATTPCANIAGATQSSFTTSSADVGWQVRVQVAATNSSGTASAASTGSGAIHAGGSTSISPADGASVPTTTPVLQIQPVASATSVQFQLDDKSDNIGDHQRPAHASGWVPSTNTYSAPASWQLVPGHTYYWAAETNGPGGISWTAIRSFTIQPKLVGTRAYWPFWSTGSLAVNEANGNLVLTVPTPSFPAAAGSLTSSLSFNSLETKDRGLGPGWALSAGVTEPAVSLTDHSLLSGSEQMASVEVVSADGGSHFFNLIGTSNSYVAEPGDLTKLSGNPTDGYLFTDADGSHSSFGAADPTTGLAPLTAADVVDTTSPLGRLTYSFAGSGSAARLTGISDDTGRTLGFVWHSVSANGCPTAIVCITGPDGRTWRYTGDGTGGYSGRLVRVNDGVRDVLAITYDGSHRLWKLQNADDLDPTNASPGYDPTHSIQVTYDGSGRVQAITNGPITGQVPLSGQTTPVSTWSFDYHPGAIATPATRADHAGIAAGTVRTGQGYTLIISPRQQGGGSSGRVYYDDQQRPIARLGPLGHVTEAGYDQRNHVVWSEDADGNPTDYIYSAATDLLMSTTGPDPDGAGALTRPVTRYRYDEQQIGTSSSAGPALQGLQTSYYDNASVAGIPKVEKTTGSVDTIWGAGGPSALGNVSDNFSIRWTGTISTPSLGNFTFSTVANGGSRLTIDGVSAIKNWSDGGTIGTTYSQPIRLKAGPHTISLEYFDSKGSGEIHLRWYCPSCSPAIGTNVVPASALTPGWLNQTSQVTPTGRVLFSHFAAPENAHPDYTLARLADGTNVISSYRYDGYGRITQAVMPKGNAARTLDADGSLQGTIDARYLTAYTYYAPGATAAPSAACGGGAVNQAQQLATKTTRGLASMTFVYDLAGRVLASTNGAGTSCSGYDAEGGITSVRAPGDSQATTYSYDPIGNQRTASNATGTISNEYDELGRQTRMIDSFGAEVKLVYNANGGVVTRTAAAGPLASSPNYQTQYGYDAADELGSMIDPTGRNYQFGYDARGNLKTTQYPNGTFSWNDYNAAGWVTATYNRHGTLVGNETIAPPDSQGSPLVDYAYVYDLEGRKTQESRTGGGLTAETYSYGYDGIGRLSTSTLPGAIQRTYAYDLDSNRLSIVQGGQTVASYTYDPAASRGVDELTSITRAGQTTSYGYGADGQVTSRGSDTMKWDGWGRFAGGVFSGTSVDYGIDARGYRRQRTGGGVVTRYLLGGLFETDAAGLITLSAADGPRGSLAEYAGAPTNASPAVFLYYTGHGDVAAEANTTAVRTAAFTYDPFGQVNEALSANATTRRWVGSWGKRLDTTSALIEMGARMYDPSLGRFLSVDPVDGGSLNSYDYAGQDPVNGYDLGGNCYNWKNSIRPLVLNMNVKGRRAGVCWLLQGVFEICIKRKGDTAYLDDKKVNACYERARVEICKHIHEACRNIWQKEEFGHAEPFSQQLVDFSCALADLPSKTFLSNFLSWVFGFLACPEAAY